MSTHTPINCVAIKDDLTPAKAAKAMQELVAKINGPLGLGMWEGTLTGKNSGQTYGDKHIAVFNSDSLVAPFGPLHDEESERIAVLFIMAFQYAEKIAAEITRLRELCGESAPEGCVKYDGPYLSESFCPHCKKLNYDEDIQYGYPDDHWLETRCPECDQTYYATKRETVFILSSKEDRNAEEGAA
ncbi:MAG: hypothetical protein DELT_00526 [Desulfovibrio sp.]